MRAFLLLIMVTMSCCSSAIADICPKGSAPAQTLYVADVSALPIDDQLFFSSLQGVIAQKEPRIYLIRQAEDRFWLDWMLKKGYIKETVTVDPWKLPEVFKPEIKGAVIPDPDLPATVNVATMLAGVHSLVICTPQLAQRFDLKIKYDLRGKWTRNTQAYRWALDQMGSRLDRRIVCSLNPYAAGGWIRDYLVQHKVFTFWITGPNDEDRRGASEGERKVISRALANWPANIPVIGFWYAGEKAQGVHEYGGLLLGGESAKFTVCYDWATNTSVHSGIRVSPKVFRQKRSPKLKLDKSKVYVMVTQYESGDAPWYWERCQRANWEDKARGTFPMGWCVGPATLDLLPDILQWYYEHATPNDNFFCSMSGAGYQIPQYYATKVSDPERVWSEFMALTSDYMKRLDLDIVSLHTDTWSAPALYGDSIIFKRYTDGIPSLKAILSDFGNLDSLDPNRANHYAQGIPVFHTRNRWIIEGDPSDALAKQISDATPPTRPAFLSIMALSWTYKPSMIKAALDKLGDGYVAVTPEQMVDLFNEEH